MSEESATHILVFILVSLFLGALAREANKHLKIPYTPLLLLLGILWGAFAGSLWEIGESAEFVGDINPHLILLIFLPALVYESSSSTDWHTFKRELGQVLVLAVPGVVVSAGLTAVAFMYILNYREEFGWADALTLGGILAATDPVAVVSLLKELGASKTLATLIEGESLLNDGVAMVMFTVTFAIATGEEVTVWDVVVKFTRMSLGGIVLGLAFGVAISVWIRRVFNDTILERTLTFLVVYVVFFLSEGTELHVSGILALVTLGLYMSAWGKTSIDVATEDEVHHF